MKYLTRLGKEEKEFVIERHGDALTARCGRISLARTVAAGMRKRSRSKCQPCSTAASPIPNSSRSVAASNPSR